MLARPEHTEDDFASVFTHQHDLDATITDDEQRIARIILEQNDAALRIALLARQLREALQLGVLELGEERNCPQEVGYLHQSECSAREQVVTIYRPQAYPKGIRWMDADSGVASRINAPWRHACLVGRAHARRDGWPPV